DQKEQRGTDKQRHGKKEQQRQSGTRQRPPPGTEFMFRRNVANRLAGKSASLQRSLDFADVDDEPVGSARSLSQHGFQVAASRPVRNSAFELRGCPKRGNDPYIGHKNKD